jgi:predicted acylesterase/phospholipase RssA
VGEIKRNFGFSAVDVNTGNYEVFNRDNTAYEEFAQACFASASIPTVFPPQHLHGFVLMDGGTVWNVNVDSAVEQCLAMGYDEKDIIIDAVVCGY